MTVPIEKILSAAIEWTEARHAAAQEDHPPEAWTRLGKAECDLRDAVREYQGWHRLREALA